MWIPGLNIPIDHLDGITCNSVVTVVSALPNSSYRSGDLCLKNNILR